MENTLRRHLEICATAFAVATGREASTVAQLATGDWQFFGRLNGGASFTIRRYDKIMAWFRANWPAQVAWPEGVPLHSGRIDEPGLHGGAPSAVDEAVVAPAADAGADNPERNVSRTEVAA